jgi:hypothetical protein
MRLKDLARGVVGKKGPGMEYSDRNRKKLPDARTAPPEIRSRVADARRERSVDAGGVSPALIQARLNVGPADDRFEREADRVAAAVMRNFAATPTSPPTARIQRSDARPGDFAAKSAELPVARIQRAAVDRSTRPVVPRITRVQRSANSEAIGVGGGLVDSDTESRIQRARGHGKPLDRDVRRSMEQGFGADFSDVNVHAGPEAHDLNSRVQAKAFTTGNDIFFQRGNYNPSTTDGQELLAHELTHVVQQGGADRVSLQRAINVDQISEMARYLGIESSVRAVEVPKDAKIKTTTPFSEYPETSKMNLTADLESKSIIVLDYPDWDTNPDYDADFKEYYSGQPATAVTDGLGGGAYNHKMDLVVLREPYSEPELLHEMGHKAQGDAGINADTASVLFLEYQNVILHQNSPWWLGKEGAEPPRLQYSSTGISASKIKQKFGISKPAEMTAEIWTDFKKTAVAALHHTQTEAGDVLDGIEASLSGRYAREADDKGPFDKQVMFNLIAEYLANL